MPSLVKPQSRYVAASPKPRRIQPRRSARHVHLPPGTGRRDRLHVLGLEALRPLLRGEVRDRGRDPVVGELGHDRAAVAGRRRREAPREVVRLAPRVDEHDGVEPRLGRHRRDEALGQLDERLVEVARVRVQEARLAHDRLGHARVAVPDDGHVVVAVEEPPPLRVEEPDALAADDVHRLPVREPGERRAEHPAAPLEELAGRRDPACAQLVSHVVEAKVVELLEQRP